MGIFSIALQAALGFAKAVISAKKGNLKTSVSLTKKTKDGKTTLKSMDELVYEVVQSAYGNYIRGKTTTMARFVGHPSVMLSPIEQLKLTMELYEPKIKCLIQENTTKKEEDIDVLDRIKEVGISYYSSYLKGLAGEQVIDKKYTLENLFTGKLTSEDMPDAITLLNMVAATKGAYYRGMYNGIKGIWDGGKMLVTETDKVLEGIYQSGSEFLEAPLKNTWEFLGDIKDGFIDSVWRSTPQEIAEDAGELAFDVAISVPTGGAGKVVSGAAKGIGKIKYLDNLVDIGKISQKIPSLQGMPLPAGGVLPFNLADDFLKAPYQMIKPDGEDVAKLTAKGDDVVKQGAKEVKKPDTIDSQKVIKEKSGKETGSGVQISPAIEKTKIKNIAEETKVNKEIDGEGRSEVLQNRTLFIKNWKGQDVKIPAGHTMSPRDPDFSAKPITEAGPYTSRQRDAFLAGNSAGTKLSPHHRHQIPVRDGGVIDEIPGPGHPSGNHHTAGSPTRHPAKSIFNSEVEGNKLRAEEIKNHWIDKGNRLIEIEPGIWMDPGF